MNNLSIFESQTQNYIGYYYQLYNINYINEDDKCGIDDISGDSERGRWEYHIWK